MTEMARNFQYKEGSKEEKKGRWKIEINEGRKQERKEGRKSDILNVHPLEFVSYYRDLQLQVSENYPYLTVQVFSWLNELLGLKECP